MHDNANYYEPVLININEKDKLEDTYYVNATVYLLKPSGHSKKLKSPMKLSSNIPIQYFDPEQPFSVAGLLKNPMFIMIGMSVLMYFCMQNMPKPSI